jgi:hypothetical protein
VLNHHHKNKTKQVCDKTRVATAAHGDLLPCHADELTEPGDIQTKTAGNDSSIPLWAYQIYGEKGGSASNNWPEAERISR